MPLPKSILTFPEDTNPFGAEHISTLNSMCGQIMELQRLHGDIEQKIQEPETAIEEGVTEETFVALIIADQGTDWPRQYIWKEAELIGSFDFGTESPEYRLKVGGKSFVELGMAMNRNELIEGFGDTVGPWGAALTVTRATLNLLPIQAGQPVVIKLENSIINEGAEDEATEIIPMFTGDNPYQISCITFSAGPPPLGTGPLL